MSVGRPTVKAKQLFATWLRAAERENETFAGTPAETRAMNTTIRAYETLVTHLDANGLTGSYYDPRGSKEEDGI